MLRHHQHHLAVSVPPSLILREPQVSSGKENHAVLEVPLVAADMPDAYQEASEKIDGLHESE